nr:hypothetical protein Iba_chr03eCG9880 [Ipomoea batatas]
MRTFLTYPYSLSFSESSNVVRGPPNADGIVTDGDIAGTKRKSPRFDRRRAPTFRDLETGGIETERQNVVLLTDEVEGRASSPDEPSTEEWGKSELAILEVNVGGNDFDSNCLRIF